MRVYACAVVSIFARVPALIGRSEAARDWPFIQPRTDDAWAGSREHPFTIRFPLADAPRGLFTLRIELTNAHSWRPPTLLMRVGGQAGRFPLQAGGCDTSLNDPAHGKPQQVELGLPASLFRRGTNDLARILHKPVEQKGGRSVRELENTELYDDTLYRPEHHRL